MPKATMPQVRGCGCKESRRRRRFIANEGVEIAVANGDHENSSSAKILHKKTTRVKFNRARIIFSKFTNRDEAGDYVWGDKNVSETKIMRGECGRARGSDRKMMPITDNNARR